MKTEIVLSRCNTEGQHLTCAVITPMGPDQQDRIQECRQSVFRACKNNRGVFSEVKHIFVRGEANALDRSRAFNTGITKSLELKSDWLCFLEANDLLLPNAFELVAPYIDRYEAIWGQIYTFEDSDETAWKLPLKLECTDDIRDIMLIHPSLTLCMGHFLKRKIAIRHPFREPLDEGQEVSHFLEVWANHDCVKIPGPLSAKRIGDGNGTNGTGRWQSHETATKGERALDRFKTSNIRIGISDSSRKDKLAQSPMDVAIFGMMRSGTTLLSDLLTVPGESIILHEPALLYQGTAGKEGASWEFSKMMTQLQAFGMDVSKSRYWDRNSYPTFRQFFNARIYPLLRRLKIWGAKIVEFEDWQGILSAFQPRKLILSVRDIRDTVLSSFDLALRMNRRVVDEAWIEEKVLESAGQLVEMAKLPHMLVRYEDLCADDCVGREVSEFCGMDTVSNDRPNWEVVVPFRQYELEKHGRNVTDISVGRYRLEPYGPVAALVDRIWRMCGSYCDRFGYERSDKPEIISALSSKGLYGCRQRRKMPYSPARSRREARRAAVSYILPGSVVLDLSCGTTSLEPMLPPESRYIPCDVVKRRDRFVFCDFNHTGELPKVQDATLVVCLGLLEYVVDIKGFLQALGSYGLPIVLTYHPRELGDHEAFSSFGWVNSLSCQEIFALLAASGFEIREHRQVGKHQIVMFLGIP